MDPIPITYASPTQPFHRSGSASKLTILDFWGWAYSDCINNTTRGVLAEFLVAAALDLDWDSDTNKQADAATRQAFAYVLCLLAEKQREHVDPLDLDQFVKSIQR